MSLEAIKKRLADNAKMVEWLKANCNGNAPKLEPCQDCGGMDTQQCVMCRKWFCKKDFDNPVSCRYCKS